MTEKITIDDVIDLLPIVAHREWSISPIRDRAGYCPLCALVDEISGTEHRLRWDLALFHAGIALRRGADFIAAVDSTWVKSELTERIKQALGMK